MFANNSSEMVDLSKPFRAVQQGLRIGQARLAAAQQRLVPIDGPVRRAQDRLIGKPQRLDRSLEAHFESGPVRSKRARMTEQNTGLLADERHAMHARRSLDDALELLNSERLRQVVECAELDRLRGRA